MIQIGTMDDSCIVERLWRKLAIIMFFTSHFVPGVSALGNGVKQHVIFDVALGTFVTFTVCAILYHCLLKRKERRRFEKPSKNEWIQVATLNGKNITYVNCKHVKGQIV